MIRHWKRIWGASAILVLLLGTALFLHIRLQQKPLVGILIHDAQSERWLRDGFLLQKELKDAGCRTALFFNASGAGQDRQLQQFLKQKPAAVVIAAADTQKLSTALALAKSQKCYVIAYDRLITNSPFVDAFVSFDSSEVGEKMALYTLEQLNSAIPDRPIRLAIIGGSRHDSNSEQLHAGILRALEPARKAGRIELANDSYKLEDAVLRDWSRETAAEKMRELLIEQPSPDAVICCSDILAVGIQPVLKGKKLRPLITGQDADRVNCRMIADGLQSMTIFKDSRLLARQAAVTARKLIDGIPLNNQRTVDNGSLYVPTFYMPIQIITAANLKAMLFDSGYYHPSLAPQTLPEGFAYLNQSGKIPLIIDLRYAPGNGKQALPGIKKARPSLAREAAAALESASKELAQKQYCLVVYEAYRPAQATLALQKRFAAGLGKNEAYSRCVDSWDHTHGSSVDVTLATLQGEVLDLGKLSAKTPATPEQMQKRKLLTDVMKKAGFEADSVEWWHFRLANEPYPKANFNFDVQ